MPIATFAADLDAILSHGGVAVVIGGVTAAGRLRMMDALEQHGDGREVQLRETTVLVRTGVFALSNNAAATVDGVAYKIHTWAPEGDGQQTRIVLRRAS